MIETPNDHQAQPNWKSRRRQTENITKNAVAKKPPAIRVSETAFSQIHSGCHSRHAPCGLRVDISRLSPKKASGPPRSDPLARTMVQIFQVSVQPRKRRRPASLTARVSGPTAAC